MNAEFLRLTWTYMRWQRLAFILVVAILITSVSDSSDVLKIYFFLSAGLWGAFSLGDMLADEFRHRTWVWQLMLPLSPSQLISAKIVCILAVPWLGGLAVSLPLLHDSHYWMYLAWALFFNLFYLLFVLTQICNKQRAQNGFLFVIMLGGLFLFLENLSLDDTVVWYNTSYDALSFILLSLLIYSLWALIGCWQSMAKIKQHPTYPLLWLAFLVWHGMYWVGFGILLPMPEWFNDYDDTSRICLSILWGTWLCTLYPMVFFCANRIYAWRPFLDAILYRDPKALWRTAPPWLIALGLVLLATLISGLFWGATNWVHYLFNLTLFTMRDIAIVLFFTLRHSPRFPEGIALFVLIILYFLLPEALELLGGNGDLLRPSIMTWSRDTDDLLTMVSTHEIIQSVSGMIQTAIAITLLWRLRLAAFLRRE